MTIFKKPPSHTLWFNWLPGRYVKITEEGRVGIWSFGREICYLKKLPQAPEEIDFLLAKEIQALVRAFAVAVAID